MKQTYNLFHSFSKISKKTILFVSATLCMTLGIHQSASAFEPPAKHPVDLKKFFNDFKTYRNDLNAARKCVELYRADRDQDNGEEAIKYKPTNDTFAGYQQCANTLREAVVRYIKAGPHSKAEDIKKNITTPVGMALWVSWTLADARLSAEDLLLNVDAYYRWVLVADGTTEDPTKPFNIAGEQIEQVAKALGNEEIRSQYMVDANDEVLQNFSLQDSAGKSWLFDLQGALTYNDSHGYVFSNVKENAKFDYSHWSAWVQSFFPLSDKIAKTASAGSVVLYRPVDGWVSECIQRRYTGEWQIQGDRFAPIMGGCQKDKLVAARYWPGAVVVTPAIAKFLQAHVGRNQHLALNCGENEGNIMAENPSKGKDYGNGFSVTPGSNPKALMVHLKNNWAANTPYQESGLRWCAPAEAYLYSGPIERFDKQGKKIGTINPKSENLGKLIMYYGIDLTN